jgi:hypothetical protein
MEKRTKNGGKERKMSGEIQCKNWKKGKKALDRASEHLLTHLGSVSQYEESSSTGYLGMSGDVFLCHSWAQGSTAVGAQWVEARNTAKHQISLRTSSTTKSYQHGNRPECGKLSSRFPAFSSHHQPIREDIWSNFVIF